MKHERADNVVRSNLLLREKAMLKVSERMGTSVRTMAKAKVTLEASDRRAWRRSEHDGLETAWSRPAL